MNNQTLVNDLNRHIIRVVQSYNKVPYVFFGEENLNLEEIKFKMWVQGMQDIIKYIEFKK